MNTRFHHLSLQPLNSAVPGRFRNRLCRLRSLMCGLLTALLLLSATIAAHAQTYRRVSYYEQTASAILPISAIPWSKYTHIIHMSCTPVQYQPTQLTSWDGDIEANALAFTGAGRPTGCKVMLGILFSSTQGPWLTSFYNNGQMTTFANTIVNYLETKNYDGVDFDWENNEGSVVFMALVNSVRARMNSSSDPDLNRNNGLISVDCNVGTRKTIKAAQANINFVNLMAYDMDINTYTGSPTPKTHYNSAVRKGPGTGGFGLSSNNPSQEEMIWYYLLNNEIDYSQPGYPMVSAMPANKINLGIPFYGVRQMGPIAGNTTDNLYAIGQTYATLGVNTPPNTRVPFLYRELVTPGLISNGVEWNQYWMGGFKVPDTGWMAYSLQYNSSSQAHDALLTFPNAWQIGESVKLLKGVSNNIGLPAGGCGGITTYNVNYEYLPAQSGDARYPLSTAMYNAIVNGIYAPMTP